MGGGDTASQQSNLTMQQFMDQLKRQKLADAVKGGFQQIGNAVATPTPLPAPGRGMQPLAQSGGGSAGPSFAATGPLFGSAGGGVGIGGAGISEEQLAAILARLGYG